MTVLTASERRLVPRWRSFRTTAALGELATTRRRASHDRWETAMAKARGEWLEQRNLGSALDFAHTAALLDRLHDAQDAIDHILSVEELPPLVEQASTLPADDSKWRMSTDGHRTRIAYTRAALREWPRDATLWTDLALLYCGQGLDKKAEKAIVIALALAPTNRYVLRCAARFFIHINDPERAVALLRRSRLARRDPWLASAEIAASQVAQRTPGLAKVGERLLSSGSFSDREVTELATSLGTLEIDSGKVRRAKKLFEESAKSPNDNVKAQFEWVAKAHREVVPRRAIHLDEELDHEALALAHQKAGDWKGSIDRCLRWGADEVFSDRPFNFGSYIAIEALGNAELAQELAEQGLQANRKDVYLLNNLAVSLAMQNRAEEAEQHLKEAKRNSSATGVEGVMLKATEGMVCFRRGDLDSGRQCYVDAIRRAKAQDDVESALRAAVYLVGEEVAAKTPGSLALSKLVLAREDRLEPETKELARRLRKASRSVAGKSGMDDSPTIDIADLVAGT